MIFGAGRTQVGVTVDAVFVRLDIPLVSCLADGAGELNELGRPVQHRVRPLIAGFHGILVLKLKTELQITD